MVTVTVRWLENEVEHSGTRTFPTWKEAEDFEEFQSGIPNVISAVITELTLSPPDTE